MSKVRDSVRKLGRKKLILLGLKKASEIALKVARKHLEGIGGKHIRYTYTESWWYITPYTDFHRFAAAGITKAVQTAIASRAQLEEALRHNKQIEAIALGKSGKGLYLKPFRKELGIYLHSQNY